MIKIVFLGFLATGMWFQDQLLARLLGCGVIPLSPKSYCQRTLGMMCKRDFSRESKTAREMNELNGHSETEEALSIS